MARTGHAPVEETTTSRPPSGPLARSPTRLASDDPSSRTARRSSLSTSVCSQCLHASCLLFCLCAPAASAARPSPCRPLVATRPSIPRKRGSASWNAHQPGSSPTHEPASVSVVLESCRFAAASVLVPVPPSRRTIWTLPDGQTSSSRLAARHPRSTDSHHPPSGLLPFAAAPPRTESSARLLSAGEALCLAHANISKQSSMRMGGAFGFRAVVVLARSLLRPGAAAIPNLFSLPRQP